MLTREILLANAALTGLTEEQITAITTLSTNDENSVIAKKTGEIYGSLDADILATSGVAKNGTEKTYDYAKRVLGDFKTKADAANGLQTQIEGLEKEKARLEKTIAEGANDAETAKALKQAKADLASITTQYNDLNTKYQESETNHAKELFGIKVDSALESAKVGLKFKEGLPETVTRVIMQQATEKIKSMNPEMIDDGNGGKIIAYKDASGAIMRNANNQLNPYTSAELLTKELTDMGVLAAPMNNNGGGTKPGGNPGNNPGGNPINITGAKTRNEAYDAITTQLLAQGLTIGSEGFDTAMTQAWKDNNIASLPER